ncbi:hypothetical protein B0A54_04024 [Friedmanniomyces endolithicus]|uniref:DDH domain-containing protein n=1 Tax=Friedmanniomyces endolithicus TaxID=329885 RepID=A0A4U0VBT6_9PEZI|nr:hypothetical protein B0A54_04024 [Friedmanniomyces endolithicus]
MKRKDPPTKAQQPSKKVRVEVPEYHLTPSVIEADGSVRWPAPKHEIHRARQIIRDAQSGKQTLIVPDKDADGLSSGAILRHTLMLLGLPANRIDVHLLSKGHTIHSDFEREQMAAHKPAYIFIVDHGSRSGPPVMNTEDTKTLIIDHHHATDADFPEGSEHVTACLSPPVATSSLLTYEICEPLHREVRDRCAWLCIVGTHGDLGNTLKWEPPFPDMREPMKKYTKKVLNDVVSLINAPRRTATYDVRSAWDALCETANPASVLKTPRLLAARAEVNAEVERCTHAAPNFSADGKVAVFRIRSEAQVHPVIATRWAGHLQSKALEIVMVANEGYLEGKVNFSCRIPRCARSRDPPVSIIARLRYYASLTEPETDGSEVAETGSQEPRKPLLERVGDDFARGHVQASGGIVDVDHFEELMRLMKVGEKMPKKKGENGSPAKQKKKAGIDSGQKNTLMGYFGSKSTASTSS